MFTGFSLVIQRLGLLLCLVAGAGWAETPAIRVAVLDNAPPMSFVDSAGQRTGFSAEIARALCEEMGVQCTFQVIMLNHVLDALVQNEAV